MPTQQVRALLAWMDKDEAVQLQLGMRIPAPGEDTAVQVARWEAARQQMQARAEYAEPTPALEPLPAELQERGQALMQRPEIVAAFQGHAWTVGIADLRQLLSYQKSVSSDAVERAAALDGADWQALFSFCLPVEGGPLPMPATVDPDGKGIAFSSPNPKLRVDGSTFATVNGQPFFGFRISFGLPFVQVVEYQRAMVSAGWLSPVLRSVAARHHTCSVHFHSCPRSAALRRGRSRVFPCGSFVWGAAAVSAGLVG